MITLHHLNNSRSQRILWLLEELGLDYEIKRYQRDPETMLAPSELKAVHPLGKSPVITDGPLTLAESGAIIDYLVKTYGNGRFMPKDNKELELRMNYWLHYAEGSAMPPLLLKLIFSKVRQAPVPFFIKPIVKKIAASVEDSFIHPQLKLHLGYLNDEIAKTGWFVGSEISAADIQMSFPIEAASARMGLEANYPHLHQFLKKIHAREAYQRALSKGGEYNLFS